MAIVAKMRVDRVEAFGGAIEDEEGNSKQGKYQETVYLKAVHGDSPENREWSKWTPNGELMLAINNPRAFDYLEPGQEYYVEIRKVRKNYNVNVTSTASGGTATVTFNEGS